MERLRTSFDKAKADGYSKFIMFLHYPPTTIGEQESPFTQMAEKYGAEQVIYSHCHGRERYDDSFKGEVNGIMYRLIRLSEVQAGTNFIKSEKRKKYEDRNHQRKRKKRKYFNSN